MNYIVPVDFSFNSKMAADDAASMASRNHGSVHLVHVIIPGEEDNTLLPVRTLQAKRNTVYEIFNFQESIRRKFNVRTSCDIVPGSMVSQIKKAAKRNSGDVIVMGMQGETGLKKYLYGSNSSAMITESRLPVMVLPVKKRNITEQKVVFLTEYHPKEVEQLSWIKSLLSVDRISIVLLHTGAAGGEKKRESFHTSLLNEPSLSGIDVQVLEQDYAYRPNELQQVLVDTHADLLVVSQNKKSLLDAFTGRSLYQNFIPEVEIPLLVMPS